MGPLIIAATALQTGLSIYDRVKRAREERRTERERARYDYDTQKRLEARYNQLRDPSYGWAAFQKAITAAQAPVTNYAAATTSPLMAAEAQRRAQRQGEQMGYDAFADFRLQNEARADSLLEQIMQRDRFSIEAQMNAQAQREANRMGLYNSLISGGMSVLGSYVGAKVTPTEGQPSSRAHMDYGPMPRLEAPVSLIDRYEWRPKIKMIPMGYDGRGPFVGGWSPTSWQRPR